MTILRAVLTVIKAAVTVIIYVIIFVLEVGMERIKTREKVLISRLTYRQINQKP
jgi:hypothetical protein